MEIAVIQIEKPKVELSYAEAFNLAKKNFKKEIQRSSKLEGVISDTVQQYCHSRMVFEDKRAFYQALSEVINEGILKEDEDENSLDSELDELDELNQEEKVEAETEEQGPVIFQVVSEKEPAGILYLYRLVSDIELKELRKTIREEKLPIFHHSPTQEGKSEKFFAENKEYVITAWTTKGKRAHQKPVLLQVVLHPDVKKALLLNPNYTSVTTSAEGEEDLKGLKSAQSNQPTPIVIKRESPKKSKAFKLSSRTFGFRKEINLKETGIFELLAPYILSITIVK